jgi:hypothetical protein
MRTHLRFSMKAWEILTLHILSNTQKRFINAIDGVSDRPSVWTCKIVDDLLPQVISKISQAVECLIGDDIALQHVLAIVQCWGLDFRNRFSGFNHCLRRILEHLLPFVGFVRKAEILSTCIITQYFAVTETHSPFPIPWVCPGVQPSSQSRSESHRINPLLDRSCGVIGGGNMSTLLGRLPLNPWLALENSVAFSQDNPMTGDWLSQWDFQHKKFIPTVIDRQGVSE